MADELKPCPFCGREALQSTDNFRVWCPNSDCDVDINLGSDEVYHSLPVKEWNNAYCWKRIAELEDEIRGCGNHLKMPSNEANQELQKRLASSESRLAKAVGALEYIANQITPPNLSRSSEFAKEVLAELGEGK